MKPFKLFLYLVLLASACFVLSACSDLDDDDNDDSPVTTVTFQLRMPRGYESASFRSGSLIVRTVESGEDAGYTEKPVSEFAKNNSGLWEGAVRLSSKGTQSPSFEGTISYVRGGQTLISEVGGAATSFRPDTLSVKYKVIELEIVE